MNGKIIVLLALAALAGCKAVPRRSDASASAMLPCSADNCGKRVQ